MPINGRLVCSACLIMNLPVGCVRPDQPDRRTTPVTSSDPAGPLFTARDPSAGIVLRVEKDGHTLVATGASGHVLWSVDVIEEAGPPAVGSAIIRALTVADQRVAVVYGKHSFASFEVRTGKLLGAGSD